MRTDGVFYGADPTTGGRMFEVLLRTHSAAAASSPTGVSGDAAVHQRPSAKRDAEPPAEEGEPAWLGVGVREEEHAAGESCELE